jgi:hypothetical protein
MRASAVVITLSLAGCASYHGVDSLHSCLEGLTAPLPPESDWSLVSRESPQVSKVRGIYAVDERHSHWFISRDGTILLCRNSHYYAEGEPVATAWVSDVSGWKVYSSIVMR